MEQNFPHIPRANRSAWAHPPKKPTCHERGFIRGMLFGIGLTVGFFGAAMMITSAIARATYDIGLVYGGVL